MVYLDLTLFGRWEEGYSVCKQLPSLSQRFCGKTGEKSRWHPDALGKWPL